MSVLRRLPEIYKALVALAVSSAGTLAAIQAVVESTGAAPQGWVYSLSAAVGAVTGFATWLKRQQPSAELITELIDDYDSAAMEAFVNEDASLATADLVDEVIARYKARHRLK